jgi:DNA-binding Lrp family transcriptional regulator
MTMTPDPEKENPPVGTTSDTGPEKVAEELRQRAEAVKEQIKRLEKAKIVKQETMQIEVSI